MAVASDSATAIAATPVVVVGGPAATAAALAAARNTYQAPTKVAAPTDVTLTGVAADGSGRTVEVTLRVVPGPPR